MNKSLDKIYYKTVSEISNLLNKKDISSVELIKVIIERTIQIEDKLKSFISYDKQDALAQAHLSDKRRKENKVLSKLDGIPISLKDNICRKDFPMTCASKILKDYISPYDAFVTKKLKDAGSVLWGQTNLDEFGMGSTTENSAFQVTSNPWNINHIPGGSSGGSASSVASGQTMMSLGSDTGGSVRQPAAYCGIVGLKPTYGLISRYGLTAFASSLDQIGIFGRSVNDVALLLNVIASYDGCDSTSYKNASFNNLDINLNTNFPWKLGIPNELFNDQLNSEIKYSIEKAIAFYESQGCIIKEISLPNIELSVPVYYVLSASEASSNLARYDGIRYTSRTKNITNFTDIFKNTRGENLGKEVKSRIMLGTYMLSDDNYNNYYLKSQKIRSIIQKDFLEAFNQVDALLTPTTPSAAYLKGRKNTESMFSFFEDLCTVSLNLAGLPGISIPCGQTKNNLPIGLQIIGKPYKEADLLSIASIFEQAHDYCQKHPNL